MHYLANLAMMTACSSKPAQPRSTNGDMIPGQTEDPSALEVMDILSLLKGGPPTTLNRDGLVYKMISRGQRVRSPDWKVNVA